MFSLNASTIFKLSELSTPMLICAVFSAVVFVVLLIIGICSIHSCKTGKGVLSIISGVFYGVSLFIGACVSSNMKIYQQMLEESSPVAVAISGLTLVCIVGMVTLLIVTINVMDRDYKGWICILFVFFAYLTYFGLGENDSLSIYSFLGSIGIGFIFQFFALILPDYYERETKEDTAPATSTSKSYGSPSFYSSVSSGRTLSYGEKADYIATNCHNLWSEGGRQYIQNDTSLTEGEKQQLLDHLRIYGD